VYPFFNKVVSPLFIFLDIPLYIVIYIFVGLVYRHFSTKYIGIDMLFKKRIVYNLSAINPIFRVNLVAILN